MAISEDLHALPLADMIGRAVTDPATVVPRERRERINDWRTRAAWAALLECGIDPHRTFVSETAKQAFDEVEVPRA